VYGTDLSDRNSVGYDYRVTDGGTAGASENKVTEAIMELPTTSIDEGIG
jgi:hypothetical protein